MYNSIQRQYVFRQKSGELWNFFHDDRLGICYSTLTKRNNWTNPVSILKNAHRSFFADMDQEDGFHIFSQDTQGTLQYSFLDGDSLQTVPVLNSKSPSAYEKHLFMVPFKNNVHFFYVLQHESSYILAYQTLTEGKISSPKVVDYVTGSSHPYAAVCDKASNIYVFYQSSDGKYLQLGYKKYNTAQKFWGEFTPVTKYAGSCDYPRAVVDSNGIIHLCYQRNALKQYEMVYQQKVQDKNLWSGDIVVHSSVHPFDNASILWLNDSIVVYWVRDDIIYYNIGTQSGNIWDKPTRLNFTAGRQLLCLGYKSNNIYESPRFSAESIPGSFVGGLKLAFHQQTQESGESLSANELRTLIIDSLKLLKASVEELKESDLELREQLSALGSTCRDLDKEVVKSTVKANFLETHLNQIKTFDARLSSLEKQLESVRTAASGQISPAAAAPAPTAARAAARDTAPAAGHTTASIASHTGTSPSDRTTAPVAAHSGTSPSDRTTAPVAAHSSTPATARDTAPAAAHSGTSPSGRTTASTAAHSSTPATARDTAPAAAPATAAPASAAPTASVGEAREAARRKEPPKKEHSRHEAVAKRKAAPHREEHLKHKEGSIKFETGEKQEAEPYIEERPKLEEDAKHEAGPKQEKTNRRKSLGDDGEDDMGCL